MLPSLLIELFVLAADREQIDVEAVEEQQILRRPADQAGILADYRLDGDRLAAARYVAVAGKAEFRLGDDAIERLRDRPR